MVKLITGIAIGVAAMQFLTSTDGKAFTEKLVKYLNEQSAKDGADNAEQDNKTKEQEL